MSLHGLSRSDGFATGSGSIRFFLRYTRSLVGFRRCPEYWLDLLIGLILPVWYTILHFGCFTRLVFTAKLPAEVLELTM